MGSKVGEGKEEPLQAKGMGGVGYGRNQSTGMAGEGRQVSTGRQVVGVPVPTVPRAGKGTQIYIQLSGRESKAAGVCKGGRLEGECWAGRHKW